MVIIFISLYPSLQTHKKTKIIITITYNITNFYKINYYVNINQS